jgi:hypothetical protein
VTESQLFSTPARVEKVFGERGPNHRYHMPLLPGEAGTKSGGDWVPGGLTSVTNLVGAFEDTRALSVWEQALALVGLALSPELYEELVLMVHQARSEGVVFEMMRNYPDLRAALAGSPYDQKVNALSVIGRAKEVAKASAAARKGTNRHTAWEHRGATGELIGTPDIQTSTVNAERLLAEAGYVRIPGLSERVVRNLEVRTAGKFDDIVMSIETGRLYIADLKTKATAFYSWMTTDAQLATYARSEWMLTEDRKGYEPGPLHHVDQSEGLILHVPSDGSAPHLDVADLEQGWRVALAARQVMDLRAAGKNVERLSRDNCVRTPKDVEIAS